MKLCPNEERSSVLRSWTQFKIWTNPHGSYGKFGNDRKSVLSFHRRLTIECHPVRSSNLATPLPVKIQMSVLL